MITMNQKSEVVNRLRRVGFDPRFLRNVNFGNGGVAQNQAYCFNGFDYSTPVGRAVDSHQNNAGLPTDSWKYLDGIIGKEVQQKLVAFSDAKNVGTVGLGDANVALGTLTYQNTMQSTAGSVSMSMTGRGDGNNDTVLYRDEVLPLPIIYSDAEIDARYQYAGMRGVYGSGVQSVSLDTSILEEDSRNIGEKLEDLVLVGGGDFSYGSEQIYGYTTAPYRANSTNSKPISKAWSDSSITYDEVSTDVGNALWGLKNLGFDGPFNLYIPTLFQPCLANFVNENYRDATWLDALMKQYGPLGLKTIKTAHRMPVNNITMVQMSTGTIKIVDGFGPTVITWKTEDKLATKFKLICMQIPKIYSSYSKKCGVWHAKVAG